MTNGTRRPTQRTTPKKGEPIKIPVPKREDVLRDLKKIARPSRPSGEK
jgi:hypothetical protein